VTSHNQSLDGIRGRERDIVLGLLPLLLGVELLASVVFVPIALKGHADFRAFYTGGYLLRTDRQHLYDFAAESSIEDRIVSPGEFSATNHPAYEYLLYVPLSMLPYSVAYIMWLATGLTLLVICYRMLLRQLNDPWLLAALMAGFAPCAVALMHGQDSILLLLLFVLAFQTSDFRAGMLVGLGAFKFHIVVPIALLYLLWRCWRFVGGFAISASAVAGISVWLVGIQGSVHYVRAVPSIRLFRDGAMTNVRGVLESFMGSSSRGAAVVAIAFALIILLTASRWKPSLETAIMIVPLASYYLMLHDLTILLLPLCIGFTRRKWSAPLQFVVPVAGFIPGFTFLAALPVLPLMLQIRSCSSPAAGNPSVMQALPAKGVV